MHKVIVTYYIRSSFAKNIQEVNRFQSVYSLVHLASN